MSANPSAWDKLRSLVEPAIQIAEDRGITLVVETGNNAMITSAYLARKLIDELGTARLKILWDPANSLYCTEVPYPDGYNELHGGALGHIHLKDVVTEVAKATLTCRQPFALREWLRRRSAESVYQKTASALSALPKELFG